jgi:ribonuclease HI
MSRAHLESCIQALEAIAEGPSHATIQSDVHYTVRAALRDLDERDRAALRDWAEAGLNNEHRRTSSRLAMLQEVLNVLDASAPPQAD